MFTQHTHTLQDGAVETAVRNKILERRSAVHERCKVEVEKRSQFEEGVREGRRVVPTTFQTSLTASFHCHNTYPSHPYFLLLPPSLLFPPLLLLPLSSSRSNDPTSM